MSEADVIEGLFRALFEEGKRAVLFRSFSSTQPGKSDDETDARAELSLWPVLMACAQASVPARRFITRNI